MVEVAEKLDEWNCPYVVIKWRVSKASYEVEELCRARNNASCLLADGDRCEIFERWVRENEAKGL